MNTSLKKLVDNPNFSLLSFVAICVILPRFGAAPMMVGCAAVLSACVSANPEQFRSRSGSLTTAMAFVAAIWVAAAVLTVLSLTGQPVD